MGDKLLLAAGIILASTFLVEPDASADVMKDLHKYSGAHPSEVAVISTVLLNFLDPSPVG